MTTLRFLLKRFVAQRLLGVAIVVTLGFTIGVLVAGPIYADAAREAILQSEVRTAAVTVANVRFTLYGGPDFAYADADAAVERATDRLPLDALVRQGRGTVRLVAGDRDPLSIAVMFRTGAFEHVPLDGEEPVGPDQIALPSSIARLLRIRIGDEVQVLGPTGAEAVVRVVGTFGRPDAPDADFWYGDQTPFPSEETQAGAQDASEQLPPALMDQDGYLATIPTVGVTSEYIWDGYIAYAGLPFVDASKLPGQVAQAHDSLQRGDRATFGALQVTTGLDTMITLVRQRVADLRVPIYLVAFQIGAVALAVVAGVGSLVLTRQSFELAVLRSRGFSGAKLLAAQGVQAVLSALVAYPLGLLIGMGLALLASNANGPSLPGVLFPISLSPLALLLGFAGAALGAITLLLLSIPHVRRTILEERRLLSREDRPFLSRIPVELFVLPVALFAYVQLRGTAVKSNFARDQLDPLVLLTPTLFIFALSFLALRLLLWILRRLDRRIGRTKSLPRYLAARRLGRSPGTSFATSLLLVLAVGLVIVSTSYRAIVTQNHEDSARQQIGADWNIQIASPEQQLEATASVPDDAMAVIRTNPVFDLTGTFPLPPAMIAVDPSRFERAGWWRDDYARTPLATWLRALEVDDPGAPVSGDFSASIDASGSAAGLELLITVEDASGEVRTVSAGPLEEGPADYEADLGGAERLLSIVVSDEGSTGGDGTIELSITDATAGEPLDLTTWAPLTWRGSAGTVDATGLGVDVTIEPGAGHVLGGISPPMPPIPALVSPEVARSQGAAFVATLGGQRLDFRRVAVADAFPSTPGDFMVVSTRGLLDAAVRIPEPGLALNEVWAMGEDPRPSLEANGFILGPTQAAGPIVAVLAQLPQSLAVGMNFAAAVGGLGLVVIGVAVGLYFAQRRREFEFASLRAMGTVPKQIARVLLLEQGLMIVFAVAAGGAIGFGVLRWLMPYVGRSIGSSFPPPVLVYDRVSLGIALCAIVAASAVGLLAALRALLRSSVTSVLRGEAE